jgi:hypothetical protein
MWAMIGVIVAALGIIGLYWQVLLTRKAVEDTGAATNAMNEANRLIMKESARNTRRTIASARDTEAALAIAVRNADAAAAQVEVARETHMAQIRPWVFVKDVIIEFENMQTAHAVVIFCNYGNWPATNFSKTVHAHSVPYPFAAEALDEPDQSLASILPPSDTETMVVENLPRPGAGFAIRVNVVWSYNLPDGSKEVGNETFIVDPDRGTLKARKMTAYDSANHSIHARRGDEPEGG